MTLGVFQIATIFIFFILLLCLAISVRINIKLGITVLKMEDSIEECLDILDKKYESISKILDIPMFFDSVEVRQVIEDIRLTQSSLLKVANVLSSVQEADRLEE